MRNRFRLARRLGPGLLLALVWAPAGRAQSTLTLDTFNAGGTTGAVIASPLPSTWAGNVTQNAGSITIGGTARDDNGWSANGLTINASAMAYVRISGQRDTGNAAPMLSLQLFDPALNSVYFSVSSAGLAANAPSIVQIPIGGWEAGFDATRVSSWSIGGGTTGLVAFRATLEDLSLSTGLLPITNGGIITTAGNQVYAAPTTLGGTTVLGSIGSNGNAITFQSTVDGAQALTLNTPGATTFAAAVGGATPLGSLVTDAGGTTLINGGRVVTTGSQVYNDSVSLGADTQLKSLTGGVTLAGAVLGGDHHLVIESATASTLGSASSLASLTKTGPGTLTLTDHSTFLGRTTVTGGTLALGVSNALANTTALTMGGGTFAANGFSQTLGALTLNGLSTIDFGSGSSALVFGDSSGETWSGRLTLLNYTSAYDSLRFGASGTGLSSSQLGLIDFGSGYSAQIDANGFVFAVSAIPEPSTYAGLAGGAALVLTVWRRRKRRDRGGQVTGRPGAEAELSPAE